MTNQSWNSYLNYFYPKAVKIMLFITLKYRCKNVYELGMSGNLSDPAIIRVNVQVFPQILYILLPVEHFQLLYMFLNLTIYIYIIFHIMK